MSFKQEMDVDQDQDLDLLLLGDQSGYDEDGEGDVQFHLEGQDGMKTEDVDLLLADEDEELYEEQEEGEGAKEGEGDEDGKEDEGQEEGEDDGGQTSGGGGAGGSNFGRPRFSPYHRGGRFRGFGGMMGRGLMGRMPHPPMLGRGYFPFGAPGPFFGPRPPIPPPFLPFRGYHPMMRGRPPLPPMHPMMMMRRPMMPGRGGGGFGHAPTPSSSSSTTSSSKPTPLMSIRTPAPVKAMVDQQMQKDRQMQMQHQQHQSLVGVKRSLSSSSATAASTASAAGMTLGAKPVSTVVRSNLRQISCVDESSSQHHQQPAVKRPRITAPTPDPAPRYTSQQQQRPVLSHTQAPTRITINTVGNAGAPTFHRQPPPQQQQHQSLYRQAPPVQHQHIVQIPVQHQQQPVYHQTPHNPVGQTQYANNTAASYQYQQPQQQQHQHYASPPPVLQQQQHPYQQQQQPRAVPYQQHQSAAPPTQMGMHRLPPPQQQQHSSNLRTIPLTEERPTSSYAAPACKRLHVTNLPSTITFDEVSKMTTVCGNVKTIHIDGTSAIVEFVEASGAERFLRLYNRKMVKLSILSVVRMTK